MDSTDKTMSLKSTKSQKETLLIAIHQELFQCQDTIEAFTHNLLQITINNHIFLEYDIYVAEAGSEVVHGLGSTL